MLVLCSKLFHIGVHSAFIRRSELLELSFSRLSGELLRKPYCFGAVLIEPRRLACTKPDRTAEFTGLTYGQTVRIVRWLIVGSSLVCLRIRAETQARKFGTSSSMGCRSLRCLVSAIFRATLSLSLSLSLSNRPGRRASTDSPVDERLRYLVSGAGATSGPRQFVIRRHRQDAVRVGFPVWVLAVMVPVMVHFLITKPLR